MLRGRPVVKLLKSIAVLGAGLTLCTGSAFAQAGPQQWGYPFYIEPRDSLNLYGMTGGIDMPSARMQPDGQLSMSASGFGPTQRLSLSFQALPWLEGSFRYARTSDFRVAGATRFDRSLDLKFRLFEETDYIPEIALGFRDILGTGVLAGEYLVATKEVVPGLDVTGGIGWGRLGGVNGFTNPLISLSDSFSTRSGGAATGGDIDPGDLFSGPEAAFFAGVNWRTPVDGLTLKAEYSSDAYTDEQITGTFTRESAINYGLEYAINDSLTFGAYRMYGSEFALSLNLSTNVKRPLVPSFAPAPPEVIRRTDDLGPVEPQGARDLLAFGMALEGLDLVAAEPLENTDTARVSIRNLRWNNQTTAIGRAARVLVRELPGSVSTFDITLVESGLPLVTTTLTRAEIEAAATAPDSEAQLWQSADFSAAAPRRDGPLTLPGAFPRFSWGISPSLAINAFDPDDPLRPDLGVALSGRYEPVRGLTFNGTLRQTLTNGFEEVTRPAISNLPKVRTLIASYLREGTTAITELTADYRGKVAPDLYGRVTAGILEQQYAGISAELLYRPINWDVGIGVEVNYARQREFDQQFGLRDLDAVTGHVSLYWDTGWHDYEVQVDAGQYLAGDVGATFSVRRRFDNGWELGGFFTLTDVPFEEFGEGSFDKGLTLTIPLGWASNRETRERVSTTVRSLTRDGGARLNVPDRLWTDVRDASQQRLGTQWGGVWQ